MIELLNYRLMRPGEEDAVTDLVMRVFDEFVAPQFSVEGRWEFQSYADPRLLLLRSRWNHFVLLANTQKEIAGMIEMRDDGQVTLFFVEGKFQGSGIGGELLRRALEVCRRRNPEVSKVTVNSSPNAVVAYEKLGFRRAGPEKTEDQIRFVPMVLDLFDTSLSRPPAE